MLGLTDKKSSRPSEEATDVVAVMRLGDGNVHHHLAPIAQARGVRHLWIVRPAPASARTQLAHSTYVEVKGGNLLYRLWQTYRRAVTLAKRPQIGALVSFNAVPYGLLALLAGRLAGKPVHVGFIGTDWYRDCSGWYGGPLNALLKRADLVTVPGEAMRKELIGRGYPADRVRCLTHVVDQPADASKKVEERTIDVLFVGNLVRRKRVDILLESLATLKANFPALRAVIVGDGPLRKELESLTLRLGIAENVCFTGYIQSPESYFVDARVVVICSDSEGLPYSLLEGIAAGAVPVATDVGMIGELIDHEVTGLLVPPGDAMSLATALATLLENPKRQAKLRAAALSRASQSDYRTLARAWERSLDVMRHRSTV